MTEADEIPAHRADWLLAIDGTVKKWRAEREEQAVQSANRGYG